MPPYDDIDREDLILCFCLQRNLGVIFYRRFLPESIRWLISKERYNDALKVMKKAASFNKVELQDRIFKKSDSDIQSDREPRRAKAIHLVGRTSI